MFFKKKVDISLIEEIFESNCTLERYQEMANSSDMEYVKIVRLLQTIKDSQRLCLKSKIEETANYRHQFMNEQYLSLSTILSGKELSYVKGIVDDTNTKFPTVVYLNISEGLYQKSIKMKSIKGKLKHLNIAISTLEDGLEDSKVDKDLIGNLLRDLTEKKVDIEKAA